MSNGQASAVARKREQMHPRAMAHIGKPAPLVDAVDRIAAADHAGGVDAARSRAMWWIAFEARAGRLSTWTLHSDGSLRPMDPQIWGRWIADGDMRTVAEEGGCCDVEGAFYPIQVNMAYVNVGHAAVAATRATALAGGAEGARRRRRAGEAKREEARRIWARNPNLTKSRVAELICEKTGGSRTSTIRTIGPVFDEKPSTGDLPASP